ncbi:hypothetical protein ACFP2F_06845 [Hymenobacter artigasi]|uniref:Lipocalin-like domain-containing protein n=1 Tax=Hymenobacter artigasi TaxID=2719616 RepID=A0ABX1HFC2_9BACT|nr:hypothetical protein [Hymenobacter artigasi]NKI88585.1 hypothetical protein [Hymenobacter artigasi]
MKSIIYSLLIGALFITSCKKEKMEPTRDEMLSGGSWKMDSMTSPLPSVTGFDLLLLNHSDLPACRLDNNYQFEQGGRYIFDDGSISCSSASQTGTGTWQWANNQSQIVVGLGGVSIAYDVSELSSTHVKLTEVQPYLNTSSHQYRVYTR